MDNYKIKVKDEAESKEAQELFFELGYGWNNSSLGGKTGIKYTDEPTLIATAVSISFCGDMDHFHKFNAKELTLPQLRDLVVLKRNDINDATHTDGNRRAFLDSAGEYHYWCFHKNEWIDSKYIAYLIQYLRPIQTAQAVLNDLDELREEYKDYHKDPALISGAEALRALADGKEVEYRYGTLWESVTGNQILITAITGDKFEFRLKPQTIKVELELPKPFEPEEDCHVYILDDGKTDGYRRYSYEVHGDKGNTFIGIWRTEEEIKQVVEQFRKIRGTNS
ncbi:hypothetical protein OIN82_14400 [Acinetobacter baumannii]|nr:hypothetical protein [Acinetobacter baumannii]